jgi:ABC-type proline/glycine betaine transport system substrate-binding protein
MEKCCLQAIKKFIKETQVTVDDMPAFPPMSWRKDARKIYEFEKLIKKAKEELWIKKYLNKYLKDKKNEQRVKRSGVCIKTGHTKK